MRETCLGGTFMLSGSLVASFWAAFSCRLGFVFLLSAFLLHRQPYLCPCYFLDCSLGSVRSTHVLARSTTHVSRLSKAAVFTLNKAHVLCLDNAFRSSFAPRLVARSGGRSLARYVAFMVPPECRTLYCL